MAASASGARGARPRLVWTTTPVAFSTRRRAGRRSRSRRARSSARKGSVSNGPVAAPERTDRRQPSSPARTARSTAGRGNSAASARAPSVSMSRDTCGTERSKAAGPVSSTRSVPAPEASTGAFALGAAGELGQGLGGVRVAGGLGLLEPLARLSLVLRHAVAVLVGLAERVHGARVAHGGGLLQHGEAGFRVFRLAVAAELAAADLGHGRGVAQRGGALEPGQALARPPAVNGVEAGAHHPARVALLGRGAPVGHGLLRVAALLLALGQLDIGRRVAVLRRVVEVAVGQLRVGRGDLALLVDRGEPTLGPVVVLLGQAAQPGDAGRRLVVDLLLGHAVLGLELGQAEVRAGVAILRRRTVELERPAPVGLDRHALVVGPGQRVGGLLDALGPGVVEQLERLLLVLRHAVAVVVHPAEIVGGLGAAGPVLVVGALEQLERLGGVLRHALALGGGAPGLPFGYRVLGVGVEPLVGAGRRRVVAPALGVE